MILYCHFRLDEEKPVLTCPEDVTSNLDEGLSTANVTFDTANVTDNSEVDLTATPSIQSGSTFDEGDNVVYFNATDRSGNTGMCMFTVTVTGLGLSCILSRLGFPRYFHFSLNFFM